MKACLFFSLWLCSRRKRSRSGTQRDGGEAALGHLPSITPQQPRSSPPCAVVSSPSLLHLNWGGQEGRGTDPCFVRAHGERRGSGTVPEPHRAWRAEQDPAWAASGNSPSPTFWRVMPFRPGCARQRAAPTCLSPTEEAEVPQPWGSLGRGAGGPHPLSHPLHRRLRRGAGAPGARGHGAVLDPAPVSLCTSHKQESVSACFPSGRQCHVAGGSGSPPMSDPHPRLSQG